MVGGGGGEPELRFKPAACQSRVLATQACNLFQVMSKLSEEQFKSGKCFSGAGSVQDDGSLPPNRFTSGQFCSSLLRSLLDSC